jgi:DNA-binding NtrC family response regulator
MKYDKILHISDPANDSHSLLAALKETGCEVVSTDSPTEGLALFYIMHSVAAVVLDSRAREQAGFDVAQSLRKIRPNVPVILLCDDQIDSSPSTDGCAAADELTPALRHLLEAEPVG